MLAERARQAGRWSRRERAECFYFTVSVLKQRGKMGKAGEEINGLAKERVSYRGIRMDKSRTCRWGSEVRR